MGKSKNPLLINFGWVYLEESFASFTCKNAIMLPPSFISTYSTNTFTKTTIIYVMWWRGRRCWRCCPKTLNKIDDFDWLANQGLPLLCTYWNPQRYIFQFHSWQDLISSFLEYYLFLKLRIILRQVSGINNLIKMSTYCLPFGDSEITRVGWLIQPNT